MASHSSIVLHVDLSSGRTWRESFSAEYLRHWLGSRGINAHTLWESVRSDTDPLGPDNILAFGVGTLTGSPAPSSGRTTVTTKSPATNLYLKTSAGGKWGAALRSAGYSNLVIHGRAPGPVYIDIDEDRVEILPAEHLWGHDVPETTQMLSQAAAPRKVEVACIGQAGENLVKMAAIMMSTYSAAARGGIGAVMGSKNLKAIVVSGQRRISIADPARFKEWSRRARENIANAPSAKVKTLYGTSGSIVAFNELGLLPTYNFQRGFFEDAYLISGQNLVESGFLKKRHSCYSCPVACHRYTEVDEGEFAGTRSGGPELETLAGFGAGCGISDTAAILKANELCNCYGLDTISVASVIQWLIECSTREVLTEQQIDGLDLHWGSVPAVLELIHRIAHRRGIGDLLAEGVRHAATTIGNGSEAWAIEVKGLEQSRVETRAAKGYALAFAVNPRGPDHLHAQPIAEFGLREPGIQLIERITGSREYANPRLTDKRAEIVVFHEDWYAAADSLGFCSFPTTADFAILPDVMANLFSAFLGQEVSEAELLAAGRRIVTLEKCFNVRQGATRADDRLPWRLMHEENPDVPGGAIVPPAQLNQMLDEYYMLHGWDLETSWPTRSTLDGLGLSDVADELERIGRVPPARQ